jgi:phytoene desaturase
MLAKKAIIIGSGISGLATAIRLSVQGYTVEVFEKNGYPGGKLSAFEKNGYQFDAGPSLFTQPQNIEALFTLAGEPISDYFSYHPVDTSCRYFFENGKRVNAFTDAEAFAAEMKAQLGENPVAVKNYLSQAERLYNDIGKVFLEHSLHKRKTWLHKRIGTALKAVRLPYLFGTLNGYNEKKFNTTETIQLFNRFATYNGSNPYKAPGMLSLIPHLELNEGVYYPKGGMVSIVQALYKLAQKKGVRFHFDTGVQRIIHHEGKVRGVVVNGENKYAPVVVSNADIYFTYQKLLNHLPKAKKLLKAERSSSALIFYWGIKKSFPELGLHNILFSDHYKEEFAHLFNKKNLSGDPTVYINITSKLESGLAPKGKENWFVMINAPANYGQDWDTYVQQARINVIEKTSRMLGTDIGALIESETILDPVGIEEKTGSFMGSLYGSSSNSKLAAFYRPANFTSYIKGLYFCGGTVHPGGGIPLCLKSAAIVASLIEEKQTINQ